MLKFILYISKNVKIILCHNSEKKEGEEEFDDDEKNSLKKWKDCGANVKMSTIKSIKYYGKKMNKICDICRVYMAPTM